MNTRESRLYQISYDNNAIGIYDVGSNGSLSLVDLYPSPGDSLPDLSGVVHGRFSLNERYFFVTAFNSNALLVFEVYEAGTLSLVRTYQHGEQLDNRSLQLQGAYDLLFHPTGQFLYVTAFHSDAWTAFKVNGSSLYEPEIFQGEETRGACHLAVSLTGDRLFLTARKASNLLVYPLTRAGEVNQPDVYHHNTPLGDRNQTLSGAGTLLLSSNGRYLYVVADIAGAISVYYIPGQGALSLRDIVFIPGEREEPGSGSGQDDFEPYGNIRICSNGDQRYLYIACVADSKLLVYHVNQNGTLSGQQTNTNDDFLQMSGGGGMFLSITGFNFYLAGNHSLSMFSTVPPGLSENVTQLLDDCQTEIIDIEQDIRQLTQELTRKKNDIHTVQLEIGQLDEQHISLLAELGGQKYQASLEYQQYLINKTRLEIEIGRRQELLLILDERLNSTGESYQNYKMRLDELRIASSQDTTGHEDSNKVPLSFWEIAASTVGFSAGIAVLSITAVVVKRIISRQKSRVTDSKGELRGKVYEHPMYISPDELLNQ